MDERKEREKKLGIKNLLVKMRSFPIVYDPTAINALGLRSINVRDVCTANSMTSLCAGKAYDGSQYLENILT